uniref:hypothetical protein n=1 Tax=Vibrio cholerae TaxID=666 RepID=UPI003F58D54F
MQLWRDVSINPFWQVQAERTVEGNNPRRVLKQRFSRCFSFINTGDLLSVFSFNPVAI